MITLLIILGLYAICSTYAMINVMLKNEKLEDLSRNQFIYMDTLNQAIEFSSIKLKEIDKNNTFKSDDEIGWFFRNILYIQELLNSFNTSIYEETKTKENISKIKEEFKRKEENKEFQGKIYPLSQTNEEIKNSYTGGAPQNTGGTGGTNGTDFTNSQTIRQPTIY